jgi:HD-like signal output (HDOD) protein
MNSDTKSKITEISSLPTIPVIISKLIGILKNENASMTELVEVIRHDQSITSRIVSIANSPFFGYPGRINSLEQAVLMLGFNLVKSISLSISILTMFPIPYVTLKKMWAHAFKVASLSGLLCTRITGNNSGVCFLAGLLHDVGRTIFLTLNKMHYPTGSLENLTRLKAYELLEAEKSLFQCNHADAAKWFLEELFFPEEIILPIYYHHNLENSSLSRLPHRDIILTLYLAEGLISKIETDILNDGEFNETHMVLFREAGFSEKNLELLEEQFHSTIDSAKNFFEL